MNYEITVNLEQKSVSNNNNVVFDLKNNDEPVSKALEFIVDDNNKTLAFYQNLNNIEQVFRYDVDKVFGNLIKLNIAINNAFNDDFIYEFEDAYSNAINNDSIDELKMYHNLTKYFYACKRGILIAYTLLRLQQSVLPEDTEDIKKLKEKELYLKKFLKDSVELIMNTSEFVKNATNDANIANVAL
jgi:hypothetical protein